MPKGRRAKRHIDDKIHPVDVGVCHEHISAIGIQAPNHNAKIIGNIFKLRLGKPGPRKCDGHQFKQHYDTACICHLSVAKDEEKETKRTDKEIQKRTRHVRAAYDCVGIG